MSPPIDGITKSEVFLEKRCVQRTSGPPKVRPTVAIDVGGRIWIFDSRRQVVRRAEHKQIQIVAHRRLIAQRQLIVPSRTARPRMFERLEDRQEHRNPADARAQRDVQLLVIGSSSVTLPSMRSSVTEPWMPIGTSSAR